jgi:hypothetical protein
MGRWKVKSDSPETISGTQVGDFDAHLPPRHMLRGIWRMGGTPTSASDRYHSAHAVPSSSAR